MYADEQKTKNSYVPTKLVIKIDHKALVTKVVVCGTVEEIHQRNRIESSDPDSAPERKKERALAGQWRKVPGGKDGFLEKKRKPFNQISQYKKN